SSRCFFFQAEDGIRDPLVTGVQTCALPILGQGCAAHRPRGGVAAAPVDRDLVVVPAVHIGGSSRGSRPGDRRGRVVLERERGGEIGRGSGRGRGGGSGGGVVEERGMSGCGV